MSTKFIVWGRFSYIDPWEPRTIPGTKGDPKYSASIMINKEDEDLMPGQPTHEEQKETISAAIEAAKAIGIKDKKGWDGEEPDDLEVLFLLDGDNKKVKKKNPEYAGHLILRASSKNQPGCVDAELNDILDKKKIYSGAFGRFEVNLFPYDTGGSNGIGCGWNHVQFIKDGEPFAGRGNASTAFGSDPVSLPKKKKSLLDELL